MTILCLYSRSESRNYAPVRDDDRSGFIYWRVVE